jgi:enoyl-CoA hydratase/carnithine racemase
VSSVSTLQIEEFEDRVVITLNRPEARNAINAWEDADR